MKQINIPYTVEKRVVYFLYRNGRYWSTREIANFLGEKREHVYGTLQNLFNRQGYKIRPQKATQGDFVYKILRGKEAFWCLRFDKIQEIESRWGIKGTKPKEMLRHKQIAVSNFVNPVVRIVTEPIINKAITTAFISITPIAREIYLGSLTVKSLYAVWNILYDSLKTVEPEDVERATYETAKDVGENIWTDYQTNLVCESGNFKSSIKLQ